MKMKCIMCGKEAEKEGKRSVCACGNWMLPVPDMRISVKKVEKPDQEVKE